MRTLKFDLSQDPRRPQCLFGGYEGEHNETELQVILPERMLQEKELQYRFLFEIPDGEQIFSVPIPLSGNTLSVTLPQRLMRAPRLKAHVASYRYENEALIHVAKTEQMILMIQNPVPEEEISAPTDAAGPLESCVEEELKPDGIHPVMGKTIYRELTEREERSSQGRNASFSVTSPGWKRVLNLIRASGGILTLGLAKAKAASGYSCQSLGLAVTGNVNFSRVAPDTVPRLYQLFNHEMGENNSSDSSRRARITKIRLGWPENGTDFPQSDGSVRYETNPVNCYLDVYVDFDPKLPEERLQLNLNYAGYSQSHNCTPIGKETAATETGIYGETLRFLELEVKKNADLYLPHGSVDAKEVKADRLKASSAEIEGYVKTTDRLAPEKYGIVRVPGLETGEYGLKLNTAGTGLLIAFASDSDIKAKANTYKPITPAHLDCAVTTVGDPRYFMKNASDSITRKNDVATARHSIYGFTAEKDEDGGLCSGFTADGFSSQYSEDLGYGLQGEHNGAEFNHSALRFYRQYENGSDEETGEPIFSQTNQFLLTPTSVSGGSALKKSFQTWLNVPTDALRTSSQSLTEAQKAQARKNLGLDNGGSGGTTTELTLHNGDGSLFLLPQSIQFAYDSDGGAGASFSSTALTMENNDTAGELSEYFRLRLGSPGEAGSGVSVEGSAAVKKAFQGFLGTNSESGADFVVAAAEFSQEFEEIETDSIYPAFRGYYRRWNSGIFEMTLRIEEAWQPNNAAFLVLPQDFPAVREAMLCGMFPHNPALSGIGYDSGEHALCLSFNNGDTITNTVLQITGKWN